VDNALKYTPRGGNVRIRLENGGNDYGIHVTDSGRGIPDREREKIFDRFYRGDQSRSELGNGLGLSLARALVEAHGGRIEVGPSSPAGSEFIIRLPAAPRPAEVRRT
jgi:signal transduction histidine kinase